MFEDWKVYGPYEREDGRQHVVLYDGETRKTISYPKYLMEVKIGRKLKDDEIVHHINGDFTDNSDDNLVVMKRSSHSRHHLKRYIWGVPQEFKCPICGEFFTIEDEDKLKRLHKNKNSYGTAGPFCSRKCVGIYGADVQNNRSNITITKFEPPKRNLSE